MQEIINKLINKKDLTKKEAGQLLEGIMKGQLSATQTAMVLTALRMKGETREEIIGFIETLKANMVRINAPGGVDVCGTGGDGKGTFNISTAVAFVLASAGVKVVKHGNRAASSKCGSADVLETLGMKIDLSPEQAERVLEKTGMVFLFAPLYHPAYKPVAIVRKELKIPTVFNFLGPFINPASVKRQLIGVSNKEMAAKLAEVARGLKYEHLILASSEDGLDEVSIFAPTTIFEVRGRKIKKYKFIYRSARNFSFSEARGFGAPSSAPVSLHSQAGSAFSLRPRPMSSVASSTPRVLASSKRRPWALDGNPRLSSRRAPSSAPSGRATPRLPEFERILGGDAKTNAGILKDIFAGKKGEPRDMVVVNSAFGFLAAGKVRTIEEGMLLVEKMIDSGAVARKVEEVVGETKKC